MPKLQRRIFGIIILVCAINLYYLLYLQHWQASQPSWASRFHMFKKNWARRSPPSVNLTIEAHSFLSTNQSEEYVAICAAVRDQSFDLPEFIRHHYFHLGIKRFYIMDDASIPPMSDLLARIDLDGVPRSAVTFVYRSPTKRTRTMQFYLYNECARLFRHKHTWIAFIDPDEFLEMTGNPPSTLNNFLRGFEDDTPYMLPNGSSLRGRIGAVAVNWRVHNSNGVKRRPPRGQCRKVFTSCFQDLPENLNRVYKSIVRTKWYGQCRSPHYFQLLGGRKTVGELGDLLGDIHIRLPITRSHIALHHYIVKSKEEFKEKMARGSAVQRNWTFWNEVMYTPNVSCNELANYQP